MSHAGTWSDSVCETDYVSICYDVNSCCPRCCSTSTAYGVSFPKINYRVLKAKKLPLPPLTGAEAAGFKPRP
ncbi:hypothetical protein AAFF_G00115140 [Aldrovandia affinis]|uniref:Uncharacterized protein n=1 Tax=Aldrovandia affinis TaxID=143900 RepID=A0AAD7R152_9TELE|nr:hypothetical protein AAFF_G00115140 [Aldrovandia affinis]